MGKERLRHTSVSIVIIFHLRALSQIHPHWNWNFKLNTKLRLEFQVEYRFKLEFKVEWLILRESVQYNKNARI